MKKQAAVTSPAVASEPGTIHALVGKSDGTGSVCKHCGVESEVHLSGGAAQRVYRRPGGEWLPELLCFRPPVASPVAEPPRPSEPSRVVFVAGGMLVAPPDETIDGASLNETVPMVDLGVAFSPVLPFPGEMKPEGVYVGSERSYNIPVEVQMLEGGAYGLLPTDRAGDPTLYSPLGPLGADIIARMRCRYLLQRGAWFKTLGRLDHQGQRLIASTFDITWRPQAGTPLAAAMGVTVPDMLPRAPPPAPAQPAPEVPSRALLAQHGERCWFPRLNDLSVLDVSKLPDGFALCAEHWERVKQAQGGALRRFGRERLYVGGRYR